MLFVGAGENILNRMSTAQALIPSINRWDSVKIKKFLQSKGKHQQGIHTAHRVGENLCQLQGSRGAGVLNYRDLHKLKPKETELPINKWAKELNRWLSERGKQKEEIQMASEYFSKSSVSPAIVELGIKTTLRYYLIPVRTAAINKSDNKR